jgi:hypothetical protein
MISNMPLTAIAIAAMIITTMPIRHAYAGSTTPIYMVATTTIITLTAIGMTQIHGTLDSVYTWVTIGGVLVLDLGMDILITDMDILITDMDTVIRIMGMDILIMVILIMVMVNAITTVMITIPPITGIVVLLELPEAAQDQV